MNAIKFGDNLRALRKARGLSQQQLASAMGLSRNQISSYESGKVEPRATVLVHFARFFEVHPAALLMPSISAASKQTELASLIRKLNSTTEDMAKVLDGFQLFYRLRAGNIPTTEVGDTHQLLVMLEQLIQANQHLLQHIESKKGKKISLPD